MSDPKLPQPPERDTAKKWWFVWILATVVIPGSSSILLSASGADMNAGLAILSSCMVGTVALVLHNVSTIKLGSTCSSMMTALLMFGGWLLMAMCFFVGCMALNR